MTDKKRLTVRLSDELEAWVNEQAQAVGLDGPNWIKMTLTGMMKGRASQPAPSPAGSIPPEMDVAADVDVDDIVSGGLEQAAALGKAEILQAQEQVANSPTRALFKQPTPYTLDTQPRWID